MSSPAAPLAPRQCSGLPVQLSSSQHGANANISDFGEGRRSYGAVQGCPRQFSSCQGVSGSDVGHHLADRGNAAVVPHAALVAAYTYISPIFFA